MIDKQWYVAVAGQQQGPFAVDALREQASRGAFASDALVWADGMADWQPIAASPLAGLLAGAPPVPGAPPRLAAQAYQPQTGAGAPPLGFAAAIKTCLSKYVTFEGRASRSEYWWFYLFSLLAVIVMAVVEGVLGIPGLLSVLLSLALFLPLLAAGVRRLHDTDRSGWWYLIQLVPLVGIIVIIVFWCQRGTEARNRFG